MKILFCLLGLFLPLSAATKKINVLFAIADDQSWPYATAYGNPLAKTPAFDQIATRGVLFNQAFCAAPQCSPSRAAILTGRQIWQLQEAGVHASNFPIEYTSYPEVLSQAGYHVGYTGKPWGPGNHQINGRTLNPAGEKWNQHSLTPPTKNISKVDYTENFKSFYNAKAKDQPFCFWYGATEPHRDYSFGSGNSLNHQDPNQVNVPAFLPDTAIVRQDLLDFAFEIEWFDKHLSQMLGFLESRGELDNTLVIVTADNGMPFPRAKANLYEHGTHVPLAMSLGSQFKSGLRVNTPVSLAQIAPTILELLSIGKPKTMLTNSLRPLLMGEAMAQNVFTGRERHTHARFDNLAYPCRAIRTERYLLIHNIKPERWPAGAPPFSHDIDPSPSKDEVLKKEDEWFDLAVSKRSEFELFDLKKDPFAMKNLTQNPEYESLFNQLKQTLHQQLKQDGDPRFNDFGDIFESYPRYSPMRPELGGFAEKSQYNSKYLQKGQILPKLK